MSRISAAALAACFLICSAPAFAATTGLVRGTVSLSDVPQANAAVTLTGEGSRFTATTDKSGGFIFPQVPFGNYRLTVHEQGLTDRTIDVTVTSNSVITANVSMDQLKEIAHSTVTAHAGAGGNPVSVNTMQKSQIDTSPNRDDLNRLIETMPGIVRFSYDEPVANGFHGITYEIDGAPLPLATSSNFGQIIDPKVLDSLEVYTGAFPAEYGGSRMGALVNLVSTRLSDQAPGSYGNVSVGAGNYAQSLVSLDDLERFKTSELYLSLNTQRNARGLDAPTYTPIHDDSSLGDEFLRYIVQMGTRQTLAVDLSNQLNQFQIPINTDPNNPIDPIFAPAGTDDVQREYDSFVNLNYSVTSKDGNGVFQFIPWARWTRIAYEGDLGNDVLALAPNTQFGDPTTPDAPFYANQIGLQQDRNANYIGARISDFRATAHHAWKVGIDAQRENFNATQTFGCYTPDCNPAPSTPPPAPPAPGYYAISTSQAQPGTLIGIYAQDKWQPYQNLAFNYGLRYDHSTGYVGGSMLEPRIGANLSDDSGRNVLHAYYGRMYAAPQLEDVRQDCVLLNGCSGEPVYDLQPQRDAYFELGLEHVFGGNFRGYINTFRRTVTNVLDTTQFLNTPLFAVYNNAIGYDSGVELRLQNQMSSGDSWFLTTTVSGSYAGGISGSTFLFPTSVNGDLPLTSPAQLSPEDHDQTVASTLAYTHRMGADRSWYGTLQTNYGTGYPVAFQNVSGAQYSGRLPSHTTLDLSLGKDPTKRAIGFNLDVQNLLNHQYIIKIANGFNTTQISTGRSFLLRFTQPF
ncbi:MAG: TonB-dependent receptor [Candidatus Eremiobacteraeota bacterium]|nr:TonB-dependent receptor [Candidatus Eremiobacteraeota bacterium]